MAGRRKSVLLCALLAFALLARSPLSVNVALVNEMNFTLAETGMVSASRGGITRMHLNVSVPGNHSFQTISFSGSTVSDADGNLFTGIIEPAPPNPYRYAVVSRGSVRERLTESLPSSYAIPAECERFALPTRKIQSGDPRIAALAAQVAANSSSDWERIAKLAAFVNSYVAYDLSLSGQEKDALWVLDARRGVCVEYAYLYAALARSQGIPTRILSGYAFGRDGTWLGHTWAESYVGEWVPVDPTWLEAGQLDATHIQVSRSAEEFFETSVDGLVEHGATLSISSDKVLGGVSQGVSVTGLAEGSPLPAPELEAGAQRIRFGGETVVYAKIRAPDYRLVDLRLSPCGGEGEPVVLALDPQDAVVAARPGEDEIVSWRIRANPDLPAEYAWSCPLLLSSNYFGTASVELVASPREADAPGLAASVAKSAVALGENQTVYYSLSGPAAGLSVGFVADSAAGEARASGASGRFSFAPKKLGENRVVVYTGRGGAVELKFNVTMGDGIHIQAAGVSQAAIEGRSVTALVVLVNPLPEAGSALVSATLGNDTKSSRVSVAGGETKNVYFTLTAPAHGNSTVEIRLAGEGEPELVVQPIEVRRVPAVEVTGIAFSFAGNETTATASLARTGEPESVNASIDGAKARAGLGEVSIRSPPGEKTLVLEWLDAAGNYYNSSLAVSVPAAPTPEPTPAAGQAGCPLAALLPALAAAAFSAAGKPA
ncbi:MAG: transglutaminase-like domain-containing protein [Candidatus ainarchaeum sp.]|nr:transglutaminase-like domain-containing protein [Candidatus ainarchaeum sp.]